MRKNSTMRKNSPKITPNLDKISTHQLNLTVLQRFDSSIQEIILTASHVAFYDFNINENQWRRKDVEGALFVVKRNKEPFDQFIVMNHKSTEYFVEDLSGIHDFDLQVPYLLYRNSSQEVNGIWFFDHSECKLFADVFKTIIVSYARSVSELESNSDFKELDPLPSGTVMERQSESINAADVSVTGAISDYIHRAINIPKLEKPEQMYYASSDNSPSIGSSNLPSPTGLLQVSPSAASSPIFQLSNQRDVSDSNYQGNQIANLVTPAIFHTPHSLTAFPLPPLSPSVPPRTLQPSHLQHPHGVPSLQLFPPPALSPSPKQQNAVSPSSGHVIDRGKVRQALLELAQDNQFIDMLYRALQNAHQG